MTPPHSASRFVPLLTNFSARLSKWLLCAGTVVLAGCASTHTTQTALNNNDHLLRDSYLLSTQSDPLGAWLDKRDTLAINYPQSDDPLLDAASRQSTPATRHGNKAIASTALKFLGVKYRYGGDAPGEGFDCSGLVAYAAEKSLGLKLPRTAHDQAQTGVSVDRDELRRGDLVFFNTLGRRYSHVGIYLGDHKFVHAPRSGAKIRVESMDIAYWRKRYNGARRLKAPTETARR